MLESRSLFGYVSRVTVVAYFLKACSFLGGGGLGVVTEGVGSTVACYLDFFSLVEFVFFFSFGGSLSDFPAIFFIKLFIASLEANGAAVFYGTTFFFFFDCSCVSCFFSGVDGFIISITLGCTFSSSSYFASHSSFLYFLFFFF
jgi:hypothetical protein